MSNKKQRTAKSANVVSIIAVVSAILFALLTVLDIINPAIENKYTFFNKLWLVLLCVALVSGIVAIIMIVQMPKYKNPEVQKEYINKKKQKKIKNNSPTISSSTNSAEQLSDDNIAGNSSEFRGTFNPKMVFHYKEDLNGDVSYVLSPKVKIIDN